MKNVHPPIGRQVKVIVRTCACVMVLGFALVSACSPFSRFESRPDDHYTLPPPTIHITPESPLTNDDLVCTAAPSTPELDTESITYSYSWYKNDVLQSELTTNVLDASYTSKKDVWKCVVVASDVRDSSLPASDEVTIINSAPTAPAAHMTPESPQDDDDLVCHVSQPGIDADSDTITYAYQWYENGVLQPSLVSDTVDAEYTSAGSIWNCVVIAHDDTASTAGTSDQVTVASNSGNPGPDPSPSDPAPSNNAPSAPGVNITPGTPVTTDNLLCSITTPSTDADGDTIACTYQWYKNNVLQSGLTTNTVGASYTTKGDVWKCVVTASDGTAANSGTSNQVTIINSAPTAPVVHVTPDQPVDSDNLTCSITTASTDADGDTITYTYRWLKNGVLQPGLISSTVSSSYTAEGAVWKCVVTASDGTTTSAGGFDEVTISESHGNGTELTFSGYTWEIRSGTGGPGPNNWSSSNAWVDAEGHLHLRLSKVGNAWYCAEVTTTQRLGFGTYQFKIKGRVDLLDKNVVLGLFNYPTSDVGPDATNEIDIEFARWGNAAYPNGNFTVWPAQEGLSPAEHTFLSVLGDSSTHQFTWAEDKVSFNSAGVTWEYSPTDYHARISSQPMPVHINLWLYAGHAPSDGEEVEIEITEFSFTP